MTVMIPAIDVRGGQVVRLKQGDYRQQTTYASNPLALAQHYAEQGAEVLHLVDLDAARQGGFGLQDLVRSIKASTTLRVQAGGGIRSKADVERLLDAGVDRVVIGTLALTQMDNVKRWLSEFGGEHITLSFDVKKDMQEQWRCASHGWTELSAFSLDDTIAAYLPHGACHLLCTDIARDGLLGGYNLELYHYLKDSWPTMQTQASGGVSSLEDVRAIKTMGLSGAILGRALLEQRFTVAEALSC